jgi:hypothetical protein
VRLRIPVAAGILSDKKKRPITGATSPNRRSSNHHPHKESFIYAQEKTGFRTAKKFHDHYSKTESAECMTQTTKKDTTGLMTVRDVCLEYKITRSQAVNIMGKIPVKLQKHRANWFAIEDIEELMNEHRSIWDPQSYRNRNANYFGGDE